MSKTPLSKFPLWHYALSFSPFFFSLFLSPHQVVWMTLTPETRVFSLGGSDRPPTCHHETIPQKPIHSFKSKISHCALSAGARRILSTTRRCHLEGKCKWARRAMGLWQHGAVSLRCTRRSQFPGLSILRQALQTNLHVTWKTHSKRSWCVIQSRSCVSELWPVTSSWRERPAEWGGEDFSLEKPLGCRQIQLAFFHLPLS